MKYMYVLTAETIRSKLVRGELFVQVNKQSYGGIVMIKGLGSTSMEDAIKAAQQKTYIDNGIPIALLKGGSGYQKSEFLRKAGMVLGTKLEWYQDLESATVICYDESRKSEIAYAIESMTLFPGGQITLLAKV